MSSRLMYGLESAQLGAPQIRRLEVFHLKWLRKILRMKTTFIERSNTNQEVHRRANEALRREGSRKTIKSFGETYKRCKINRMHRILKATPSDPVRNTNLNTRGQAWAYHGLKQGRPKTKWANEAMRLYWEEHRDLLPPQYKSATFDYKHISHAEALQQVADNIQD